MFWSSPKSFAHALHMKHTLGIDVQHFAVYRNDLVFKDGYWFIRHDNVPGNWTLKHCELVTEQRCLSHTITM